jgi:hypothetical protein
MSNTMKHARCPSSPAKYAASGCNRSTSPPITWPIEPSAITVFPAAVSTTAFSIMRMSASPAG